MLDILQTIWNLINNPLIAILLIIGVIRIAVSNKA